MTNEETKVHEQDIKVQKVLNKLNYAESYIETVIRRKNLATLSFSDLIEVIELLQNCENCVHQYSGNTCVECENKNKWEIAK